jgi:hypothetical protein
MAELHASDSLKSLRETLCIAQSAIAARVVDVQRQRLDIEKIGRLIADIDRQRPLGPDGKHGTLHTQTCGCA